MKGCRLYVILDRKYLKGRDIRKVCEELVCGGVDVVQYRDKCRSKEEIIENVKQIKSILEGSNVLFIVNDYPDIAQQVGASGVHLGQEDIEVEEARKAVGQRIIGVSTHSLEEAVKAEKEGADYIAIGPVFRTPTKPELDPIGLNVVMEVKDAVNLPVFAVGGISLENIDELLKIGITQVAVCSVVLNTEDIRERCKKLKRRLLNSE